MHAAGLIYDVRSQAEQLQSEASSPGGLRGPGSFFGQPDRRPTARELLASRPGAGDPIPRGFSSDARLKGGYERFDYWRQDNTQAFPGRENGAAPGAAPPRAHRAGWLRPGCPWNPCQQVRSVRAAAAWKPADQDKRSWWRRGGRS